MFRKFMCSKIHRATITQCDPDYVGSITIDADLMCACGIRPNEAVHVLDTNNGARYETYAFYGEPGSGIIGVNGPAAKLVEVGHKVIIVAYGLLTEEQVDDHVSITVVAEDDNRPGEVIKHASLLDEPAPTIV